MYAQATTIRVPLGTMPQMRKLVEEEYLPRLRERPGFMRAYFLEQVDDPDAALLLVVWESHAAVEAFNRTGLLEASVQALASRLPGVVLQRQGYVSRVTVGPPASGHSQVAQMQTT
jgi:heme-degrading monooxygenase HmoA